MLFPDIIEIILFFLKDDRRALKSCSLISTAWEPAARKHLFSKICLVGQHRARIPKFYDLLTAPPLSESSSSSSLQRLGDRLPSYVREVVIPVLPAPIDYSTIDDDEDEPHFEPSAVDEWDESMGRILAALTATRRILVIDTLQHAMYCADAEWDRREAAQGGGAAQAKLLWRVAEWTMGRITLPPHTVVGWGAEQERSTPETLVVHLNAQGLTLDMLTKQIPGCWGLNVAHLIKLCLILPFKNDRTDRGLDLDQLFAIVGRTLEHLQLWMHFPEDAHQIRLRLSAVQKGDIGGGLLNLSSLKKLKTLDISPGRDFHRDLDTTTVQSLALILLTLPPTSIEGRCALSSLTLHLAFRRRSHPAWAPRAIGWTCLKEVLSEIDVERLVLRVHKRPEDETWRRLEDFLMEKFGSLARGACGSSRPQDGVGSKRVGVVEVQRATLFEENELLLYQRQGQL